MVAGETIVIRNARVTTEGHVTRRPEFVFVGPDIKEAIVQKLVTRVTLETAVDSSVHVRQIRLVTT